MTTDSKAAARPLIRAVLILQLKLALSAARDIVLIPLALAAAVFDLMRLKTQTPRYFNHVLRAGEHSDRWIDVWYAAHHDTTQPPRENVDALLNRVEEVVRDPQTGARRARVLKRWAERQMQRARQRATEELQARKLLGKE